MSKLPKFVVEEIERADWNRYTGGHVVPKDTFIRDGVLLSVNFLKSQGMFYVSLQTMSKVDVRLVVLDDLSKVIKNGKWSK